MIKRILSFYALVLVPVVYGFNLWMIVGDKGSMPIDIGLRAVGAGMMMLGLGVWIVSWINLGGAFGILPRKQKRVGRGLYRYLRHPMYWGIMGSFLGMGIASGSASGILVTMFILVPLLIIRASLEERKLT